MSQEPEEYERMSPGGLQHAAEHEKPRKKPSVLLYLVILFAAAFLLMALSYLMQQRASTETIEGLKESVSAMQSVENMQKANEELKAQVLSLQEALTRLEEQRDALQSDNNALRDAVAQQEQSAQAMDWFWRIQREVSRGRYAAARSLVADFQATGLEGALPADHPADPEGPSPAEQYQEILDVLS